MYENMMELIELGDGSSSVSILTQILWYNNFLFYSYFGNLELLKFIFIFVTTLSDLWMDRYEEVGLERKDNICCRVEILWQMERFHQARANKSRERDLHVRIKEMHTHLSETELKEEEEELKQH
jgi:hypothetical protein